MPLNTIVQLPSYYVTAQMSGPSGGGPSGTNKPMLSLLNPTGSGKTVKIRLIEFFALLNSGTNVYIDVQLRRITAHTNGTDITPSKRSTDDDAAVAEVKSEPDVTGGAATDIIQQMVVQANNPSAGEGYRFRMGTAPEEKPITLKPGEGVVIHQVTSNGGTFAPGLVWTEE